MELESSEKDNLPDSATIEGLTGKGQPPPNEAEAKASEQRGSIIIDEGLEYRPEDYPPDSDAFHWPTNLEECQDACDRTSSEMLVGTKTSCAIWLATCS